MKNIKSFLMGIVVLVSFAIGSYNVAEGNFEGSAIAFTVMVAAFTLTIFSLIYSRKPV
ncbi:MAG: hypothetical protein HQ580_05410 [Planctomycetes bacterium]|nr:hypothetical protein [Planctomycetota bacterium]